MNMQQATEIVSDAVGTLEPKVAEAIAHIVTAWSDKYDALFLENKALERQLLHDTHNEFVASRVLDRVELAEFKARMQVEQLTDALQKIHTEFTSLAVTAESNQAQLLEQLERLQQTDVYKALEENKRLREALEEIEGSSANDFDGIRLIARQALEG